jgi:predicted metal-binding protein
MDDIDLDDLDIDEVYEGLIELKKEGEIEHLPSKKLVAEICDLWGFEYLIKALTDEAVSEFLAVSSLIVCHDPECTADEFDEWVKVYEREGYEALSKKPLKSSHHH